MTLDQLRIFIAVAEREHVTQAAQALGLTQSATSAAIAALESSYDTRLFDRVGRRIRLTQSGRLFLAEARMVLARAAAAETVLSDLAGLKRGVLNLAGSQTVANYWLPRILHEYQSRHPGIRLELAIGNTSEVADRVREGTADLGFIEADLDDPVLIVEPVAEDELVLVTPPGHPWTADGSSVSAEELRAAPWVVREPGSGTRVMMEAALLTLGVPASEMKIAMQLPSNETVRGAVEAGAGITIVSRLVAAASLAAGALAQAAVPIPRRKFYALRHSERHFTQASQAFLRLLDQPAPEAPANRKPDPID